MLRILPTTKKKKHLVNSFAARQVRKWVVKRATRFVAMLIAANRVAGFLLPLLLQPYKKKCYSNPILFFFLRFLRLDSSQPASTAF